MVTTERINQVLDLWNQGKMRSEIKDLLHMDSRTVTTILKEHINPRRLAAQFRKQRHSVGIKIANSRLGIDISESERTERILQMWREGVNREQMLKQFHISRAELNRVLRKYIPKEQLRAKILQHRREATARAVISHYGPENERRQRWEQMAEMWREGASFAQIGKRFGLTRQGAAICVKRCTAPKPEPTIDSATLRRQVLAEKRAARQLAMREREKADNAHYADAVSEQAAVYSAMLKCNDLQQYQRLAKRYSELQMKIEFAETRKNGAADCDLIIVNL